MKEMIETERLLVYFKTYQYSCIPDMINNHTII
jgi:hypothetical protein